MSLLPTPTATPLARLADAPVLRSSERAARFAPVVAAASTLSVNALAFTSAQQSSPSPAQPQSTQKPRPQPKSHQQQSNVSITAVIDTNGVRTNTAQNTQQPRPQSAQRGGRGGGRGGRGGANGNQRSDNRTSQQSPPPASASSTAASTSNDQSSTPTVTSQQQQSAQRGRGGANTQSQSKRGGRGGAAAQQQQQRYQSLAQRAQQSNSGGSANDVHASPDHTGNSKPVSSNPHTNRPNKSTARTNAIITAKQQQQQHYLHSVNAQEIIQRMSNNTYECSICADTIGRRARVWSCTQCCVVTHQTCIEKWYAAKRAAEGGLTEISWYCPACMHVNVEPPPPYSCWCTKVLDPEYQPGSLLTPHSCGSVCGKLRSGGTQCPHPCTLQCHPGKCPDCSALGALAACGCGKTQQRWRCGDSDKGAAAQSCGKVCDRVLACGTHRCELTCHLGPCEPCTRTVEQTCYCGCTAEQRSCGSGAVDAKATDNTSKHFSCNKPCSRPLQCGNHNCTRSCHAGACTPCTRTPKTPTQPCACGKCERGGAWLRTRCTDPLPTCSAVCDNLLACGVHRCTQKCHDSPCSPCTATVKRQCSCQRAVVALSCPAARAIETAQQSGNTEAGVKCDTQCKIRLSCNRHTCNERCCPQDTAHLCLKVCGKPLECGQHSCDQFCHLGQCKPCAVTYRQGLACKCERTRTAPNTKCGTVPNCRHPCSVPRDCGHPCMYTCHLDACPPCAQLTSKECAGAHKTLSNIPCFATAPSCGVPCKKPLACGAHVCLRPCHGGDCLVANPTGGLPGRIAAAAATASTCGQKCGKTRRDCKHKCIAPCHEGWSCPDVPCLESLAIFCECRRQTRVVKCGAGSPDYTARSLPCNEDCAIATRNAKLRDALTIQQDARQLIPYPTELLEALIEKQMYEHIQRTEKDLEKWLATPPSASIINSTSSSTKHFPPMSRDARWCLHQLAPAYAISSESFDQEPRRSVRYLRTAQSELPTMLLSKAIQLYRQHKLAPAATRTLDSAQVLHFVDLQREPSIPPSDLALCLAEFAGDFRINWLDATHALAVFYDTALLSVARQSLIQRGMFAGAPQGGASEQAMELAKQYPNNILCRKDDHPKNPRTKPHAHSSGTARLTNTTTAAAITASRTTTASVDAWGSNAPTAIRSISASTNEPVRTLVAPAEGSWRASNTVTERPILQLQRKPLLSLAPIASKSDATADAPTRAPESPLSPTVIAASLASASLHVTDAATSIIGSSTSAPSTTSAHVTALPNKPIVVDHANRWGSLVDVDEDTELVTTAPASVPIVAATNRSRSSTLDSTNGADSDSDSPSPTAHRPVSKAQVEEWDAAASTAGKGNESHDEDW